MTAVLLWLFSLFSPEQQFRAVLTVSPWPASLHDTVTEIARCESQFDHEAVSEDGEDYGYLQIRASQHPELAGIDLLDGWQNIIAGYLVYQKQGFGAWACQATQ